MNRPSINPMNVNIKQKKVADEREETEQNNNTVKQQNNATSSKDAKAEHVVIPDLYALYLYTNTKRNHVITGQYSRQELVGYFRIDPVLYDRVSERLIKLYESKHPNLKKMNGFFRLEPVCFAYTWFKYIEFEDRISNV